MTVSGAYGTIEPPRRLVLTRAPAADKGGDAAPGGARLVPLQQLFDAMESGDRHQQGSWSFDRLDRAAHRARP
jgi:hypothetical protein